MARTCKTCAQPLSFFNRKDQCPDCQARAEAERQQAREANQRSIDSAFNHLATRVEVPQEMVPFLARQERSDALALVQRLQATFASSGNMNKAQLKTVLTVADASHLTHQDIRYNETIRPHQYMASINEDGRLPTATLDLTNSSIRPVFQKGEIVHFGSPALLREYRSRVVGWEGGSRGWSIPIGKHGFRYRVGSYKGHPVREEGFETTSRGLLLITSKRLLLAPMPGNKPLSIALRDIVSYAGFDDAVEVYKKSREKSYMLHLVDDGATELALISLGFLLNQATEDVAA